MKKFGEFIKARRDELRLSQRELGERCGTTDTFICNLEHGKRDFKDLERLFRIAEELGVPCWKILEALGVCGNREYLGSMLLKGVEKLDPADLKYVQFLIDGILGADKHKADKKR